MSLTGGAPLVIEDLDVTMPCVTYQEPYLVLEQELSRILKQLNQRRIPYKMERRGFDKDYPWRWNVNLTVGSREYPFLTYVVGHW